ncbi:hypothetical protein [Hafnia psychrotolerans]|uniref:Uncharacterized protein n=1 Tax=Hafnia psychrotolerans TaxID=1477018 RepID=A0ABQ1H2C1_9GAMM|nr:hypothetical protein [Hafnia psychrotolerans]GGA55884.1 hypothetical protein GCM10011328_34150 [Hafnia psychrotolerans]
MNNVKGDDWELEALAKRWDISPRQQTRIAAGNGLPDRSEGNDEEKMTKQEHEAVMYQTMER